MRDEEKLTLSRALEECLAERLAAIRIDLTTLRRRLEMPPEPVLEVLTSLEKHSNDAVAAARHLANTLLPGMVEDGYLAVLIKQLCKDFAQRSGVPHHFESDRAVDPANTAIVTLVYGLAQELLAELGRQSHLSRVDVSLARNGSDIHLLVQGNGGGLQESTTNRCDIEAIDAVRERIVQNGGMLSFDIEPGRSIQYKASIPLI